MTLTEVKDFLTSLSPDKGQAEEMHGWRFDEPLEIVCNGRDRMNVENFKAYILERLRRAESQEVPDLKEKVKAAILAGMDAEFLYWSNCSTASIAKRNEFRALCAPEEVKP